MDHDHADDQCRNGPDLHVRTQVIARDKEQPDRKHRGDESVDRHGDDDPFPGKREVRSEERPGNVMAQDHRGDHGDHPDDARFRDLPRADAVHPEPDEQRDRNGHGDRERPPGAFPQGVDHRQAEARQGDHEDNQDGDGADGSRERADLIARDLRQRTPLTADEATSVVKSCTAPASTTPINSQRNPGRKPNCAARTGPISGPAPAIAAK